jgi:hypothetical protein
VLLVVSMMSVASSPSEMLSDSTFDGLFDEEEEVAEEEEVDEDV